MATRVLVLSLVLLGGCPKKEPEYAGVGQYMLKKTKLVDGEVNFRCDPSGATTFCFGGPDLKLGDQPAAVSLYFGGKEKDSPLVEIALSVRGCDAEKAEAALTAALGPPTESAGKQVIWAKKAMFVNARLRDGGSTCDINFVDLADEKRIADLRAGK